MTVAKFGKLRQGKPIERYYGSQAEGGRRLSVHDPRVRVYTESDDPQGLGTRTVDFILKHLDPTGQLSDNKAGSAVDRGIGAMASGIGNGLSAAFKDWLETENQRYGVGDRTEALRIEKQAADVLGHGVGNLAAGIGGAPFSAAQMFTTVYASPFNKQAGQEVDKFADANLNSWGVGPDGPITKIAHGNIKGGVNQLLDKAWENPVDAVTLLLGGYQALRGGYQAVGMMREGLIAGAARVEAKAQAAGNTPLGQSLKARAATIRAQAARLGNALNDHVAQTKFSGSEPPLEQPHTRLSSETSASAAAPALVSADPWIQASNDPATALKGKSEISYYRTTQGDVFPRGSISTDIHGKPIDLNRVLEVYDTQGNLVWKRGNGHSPTVTPPPQLEDSWYARVIGRRIPKDASQTIQAKPGQAKQTVDNAIAAIDKVHRVGHVGKIAIVTDKSTKDINARGHYNGDPADFHIAVAHDGPWPALTFVHEYGHFLDHSGFFGAKRFASLSPKHLNEWRKIVMNSQAIKDLKDAQANSGNITERNGNQVFTMSQKRLAYLLDEREIFARSYAQYIATRSGDPTLVNDLNNALSHGSSKVHRELWEPDDFKPIADEFDKLFANHRGKP